MANGKNGRRNGNSNGFFAYLIPLTLIGLTIADFVRDGQIDKYLIGALMIFGLGAAGWRLDSILEKYLASKGGGSPPGA